MAFMVTQSTKKVKTQAVKSFPTSFCGRGAALVPGSVKLLHHKEIRRSMDAKLFKE
jgi:hypothetical protein